MAKRSFDIIFSILGLLLFIPVFIFIILLIKITSKGPVFFVQKRVGRNGICFNMIKFRSMFLHDNGSNSISIKGDQRITPLGRILRKYKLDELPELLNVLFGHMSFVGPRPDVPGYADCLQGEERKILMLRPGITGPASLKYSNEEEILAQQDNPREYNDQVIYPDKVKINLQYYYRNNIIIDIKIIFATIFKIL